MLELKKLSFAYSRANYLFSNLDLSLRAGSICGLLGKNGSGKTTLLKIIAGVVFPLSGVCNVSGHIPTNRQPSFLQDVFFLPEDIYVPAITGKQYINLYASFYPRFDDLLLEEALQNFEIGPERLLSELSYGQKKKFLIAFALATHCKLLILDEPTNGLDIPSKAQFRKAIASAISEEKLFIISTHQVHDVEKLVDTIVMIDNGDIIFNQNIFDIASHLAFVNSSESPLSTDIIYSEKQVSGYKSIIVNNHQLDTEVDLEFLFNAILLNKVAIQNIFSGGHCE